MENKARLRQGERLLPPRQPGHPRLAASGLLPAAGDFGFVGHRINHLAA